MRRRKSWDELEIRDNFLFLKVMYNADLCRPLLEKILGMRIKTLSFLEMEKTIESAPGARGVRLDLYMEDERNQAFNIEMQATRPTRSEGSLGLRSRYYLSLMDQRALEKGQPYTDLRNTFIIFICDFDPFGHCRRRYTFRSQCLETPGLDLADRATRIFLNARGSVGDENEDLRHFLEYVAGKEPVGDFTRNIAAEVARVKQNEELKVEYMRLGALLDDEHAAGWDEGWGEGWDDGWDEGWGEGKNVGIQDGQRQIMAFMQSQGRTDEEISELTGLPLEKIRDVLEQKPQG